MKRLLQRISDGLYYQGPGSWTGDPNDAFDFASIADAITLSVRSGFPPMQVVLRFGDIAYDVRIPCAGAKNTAALENDNKREAA